MQLKTTLPVDVPERQDADARSAAVALLTEINLDDLISSFGWEDRPLLKGAARRLLRKPAQTFARQIVDFDNAVGKEGLPSASRRTVANYVRDVRVFGREHIPAGAFLALANHPGMTDALSLFAALDRPDILVVALPRPFLQALPHLSQQLSCVSEELTSYSGVVRKVGLHLRAGGAALSFPAGHIEPDPDLGDGAEQSLQTWVHSAAVFARLAPEAAILPVLVRGVVWPKAAHNWLLRLKQPTQRREKLAAALQLLAHVVMKARPVTVSVQIGRPLHPQDLCAMKPDAIHEAVMAEMSRMIRNPPDAAEGIAL